MKLSDLLSTTIFIMAIFLMIVTDYFLGLFYPAGNINYNGISSVTFNFMVSLVIGGVFLTFCMYQSIMLDWLE